MYYTHNELIRIAKRENNTKRSYLVVNPLQAKHIPVSPTKTIEMFDALADKLEGKTDPKNTLIIGFAETATAIGSHLAIRLGTYYMQTTRESIARAKYIYFTEEHSHAAEQKIIRRGLDKIIDEITDIIFAEDELTTGQTILNAVHAITKAYKKKNIRFHVASIINGMDKKALNVFARKGITVRFLAKINNESFEKKALSYESSGNVVPAGKSRTAVNTITVHGAVNPRIMTNGKKYAAACKKLFMEILQSKHKTTDSLLVIGTEECMYPAIFAASKIEKKIRTSMTHSTTRSPIAVCTDEDYPLHTRYELHSLYDAERTTYIYDLACYDHVMIVTDAEGNIDDGLGTLIAALETAGNRNIELVRWIP